MKKKLMISVALLAVLGAAVVGYFHFSYKKVDCKIKLDT